MRNRPLPAAVLAALVGCALAALTAPARAALGAAPMPTPSGATTTVLSRSVRAASAAAMTAPAPSAAATTPYSVRATTYSSGTHVREYVGPDGRVFGIAWNGPRMPELSTLLGNYFPQYASGVQALRATRRSRGPVAVEEPDLFVHSGGHMGSFFGQAWLPNALPAGMTGADIK